MTNQDRSIRLVLEPNLLRCYATVKRSAIPQASVAQRGQLTTGVLADACADGLAAGGGAKERATYPSCYSCY